MKDLKISVKVAAAFAVILMLFIASSLLTYRNIEKLFEASTTLEEKAFPSLVEVLNIKYEVSSVRRLAGQIIIADINERESLKKRTTDLYLKSDNIMKRIKSLVGGDTNDPGTLKYLDIVNRLDKSIKDYFVFNSKLIEHIDNDQISDAREILFVKSRDSYNEMNKVFSEIEKSNIDYASFQTSVIKDKQKSLINILIITNIIVVSLSVVMVYFIVSMMKTAMTNVMNITEEIANGNLTSEIPEITKSEIGSVYASLKKMQENLTSLVRDVRQGSESVSNASAEIATGNQDLSARTESQASSLQETASSAEELSATVSQNAKAAREANGLASASSHVAMRGTSIVSNLVSAMDEINDSSKKIENIIGVIDSIAFQTNILALNAAVEAARAGEQGKGFAVVASEVRSLAGRSAEAAKEIKLLINESVDKVIVGKEQADKAGVTMMEVMESVKKVCDLLANIDSASQEQAKGVEQVGQAVNQMDQATQQNAALVEEMAAAASSLNSQAKDLVDLVSYFRLNK